MLTNEQQLMNTTVKQRCEYLLDNGYCKKDVVDNSYFCVEHSKCKYLLDNGLYCNEDVIDKSYFCAEHSRSRSNDVEVFKAINKTLLQNLGEYWTRTNVYLVVQGAILSGFALLISSVSKFPTTPFIKLIALALCVLGLFITILWFWVAYSSLEWIRKWRFQMVKIGAIVDRRQYHTSLKLNPTGRFSRIPTRITLILPAVFVIAWIFFLILGFFS